jgi:hypothetical protein
MENILNGTTQLEENLEKSTDRKFGIVVGSIFIAIALIQLIVYHKVALIWTLLLGGGGVLFLLGIVWPNALKIPNSLWHLLGLSLAKITNPIVLGLLFYFCFAPIGILLRILKLDILSLNFDKSKASYWVEKERVAPDYKSMKLQF